MHVRSCMPDPVGNGVKNHLLGRLSTILKSLSVLLVFLRRDNWDNQT